MGGRSLSASYLLTFAAERMSIADLRLELASVPGVIRGVMARDGLAWLFRDISQSADLLFADQTPPFACLSACEAPAGRAQLTLTAIHFFISGGTINVQPDSPDIAQGYAMGPHGIVRAPVRVVIDALVRLVDGGSRRL